MKNMTSLYQEATNCKVNAIVHYLFESILSQNHLTNNAEVNEYKENKNFYKQTALINLDSVKDIIQNKESYISELKTLNKIKYDLNNKIFDVSKIDIKDKSNEEIKGTLVSLLKSLVLKTFGIVLYSKDKPYLNVNLLHPISLYKYIKDMIDVTLYDYILVYTYPLQSIKPESYEKDYYSVMFEDKILIDFIKHIEINSKLNNKKKEEKINIYLSTLENNFTVYKEDNLDNLKYDLYYLYSDLAILNGKVYPHYSMWIHSKTKGSFPLYKNATKSFNVNANYTKSCSGKLPINTEYGLSSLRITNGDSSFHYSVYSKYLYDEIMTYQKFSEKLINEYLV